MNVKTYCFLSVFNKMHSNGWEVGTSELRECMERMNYESKQVGFPLVKDPGSCGKSHGEDKPWVLPPRA